MIRTEKGYEETKKRIQEGEKLIEDQKAELKKLGISDNKISKAIGPLITFHEQMVAEVKQYERIKKGDFSDFKNISDVGKLLIALRISEGTTQRELAHRLGVSEAQVSRDERNEYYKISPERTKQILFALGIDLEVDYKVKNLESNKQLIS